MHILQIVQGFKGGAPAFARATKLMQKKLMLGKSQSATKQAEIDNPLVPPKSE